MKIKECMKKFVAFILAAVCIILFSVGCSSGGYEELSTRVNYKNSRPASSGVKTTDKDINGAPSSGKRVAITFDDGPHNIRTKAIVDELTKYDFNATFFVIGNRVDGNAYNGSGAVKYAFSHGNEIAIHGYTHAVYYHNCEPERYKLELSKTYEAIKSVVPDADVRLMRPIGGVITDERVAECPYSVVTWSVDSEDWKNKGRGEDDEYARQNVDTIVENVMSKVKSGDIILMHDIYENTYEAAKIILARLHEEGYDVVSVSELLGNTEPGVKYSRLSTKS